MDTELEAAMTSLGFTPAQRLELAGEPERAWEWINYTRGLTSLNNPTAYVMSRFRSGELAPDPNAWRGEEGEEIVGDYRTLLACCEALTRNNGHEYREDDLSGEFDNLGSLRKVGNGAKLTDDDRTRLLKRAEAMKVTYSDRIDGQAANDRDFTIRYYVNLILDNKLSEDQFRKIHAVQMAPYIQIEKEVLEIVNNFTVEVEEGETGICDDCKQVRPLAPFGKMMICAACLIQRQRVGKHLEKKSKIDPDAFVQLLKETMPDPVVLDDPGKVISLADALEKLHRGRHDGRP